jgi:hypothetical protein
MGNKNDMENKKNQPRLNSADRSVPSNTIAPASTAAVAGVSAVSVHLDDVRMFIFSANFMLKTFVAKDVGRKFENGG